MGKILAVCKSDKKGTSKKNIKEGILKENYALVGDAHAGPGLRQISLLAKESLEEIKKKGLKIGCGGFGENLTTLGIELTSLVIGTRLKVGENVLLEVTQIGKTCKKPCKIYQKLGNCILPSQGIFARVLSGGMIKEGDTIEIVANRYTCGILIISDRSSRGERPDKTGPLIKEYLNELKITPVRYKLIPDEKEYISLVLATWTDRGGVDLILTSGGTGFSSRDVTPEATRGILDKEAGGLAEMMRTEGAKRTKRSYLSRGVTGIRKKTLIVNLPGNPQGARESLEIISPILSHAIKVMKGTPCEE